MPPETSWSVPRHSHRYVSTWATCRRPWRCRTWVWICQRALVLQCSLLCQASTDPRAQQLWKRNQAGVQLHLCFASTDIKRTRAWSQSRRRQNRRLVKRAVQSGALLGPNRTRRRRWSTWQRQRRGLEQICWQIHDSQQRRLTHWTEAHSRIFSKVSFL